MAFPINIEALLRAQTVESERSDFLEELNLTEGRRADLPTIYARPLNNTPPTSLTSGFGLGRVREYTPRALTLSALYPGHSSKSRGRVKSPNFCVAIGIQVWSRALAHSRHPHPQRLVFLAFPDSTGRCVKTCILTHRQSSFFKDLYAALEANGSPAPHFETDEEASYFLAVLYARLPEDKDAKSTDNASKSTDKSANSTGKDVNSVHKDPNSVHKGASSEHNAPNSVHKDTSSGHNDLDSGHNDPNSEHKDPNSVHNDPSSEHKDPNSEHKNPSSEHKNPNSEHKNPSSGHKDPDSGHKVDEILSRLGSRASGDMVRCAILLVCADDFVPLPEIATSVKRSVAHVRQRYVNILLKEGLLERRYEEENHPEQAYRTTAEGLQFVQDHEDPTTERNN